jgi:hypothetical protein
MESEDPKQVSNMPCFDFKSICIVLLLTNDYYHIDIDTTSAFDAREIEKDN